MHKPAEILTLFEKELASDKIHKDPQELYDPVNYILSLGGKRIRPVMVLMACEMFGGTIEKAMPAALGIEMFHNFSLVHDDIMDQAPIRRGHSTVHKKWNTNTAILSGDTMLVLAYEYFQQLDDPLIAPVTRVFGTTAKEVCEGQQYDMNFENEHQVTLQDYLEMIRLKTAVLIGASFKIGSMVAGANQAQSHKIYEFGVYEGMAFQLMDDLLDTFGNEKKFGKRLFGDIRSNKKTFLYLKALDLASATQKETLRHLYSEKSPDIEQKIKTVVEIFRELNIQQHTEELISWYHEKALSSLGEIPISDDKKRIVLEFTGKLIARVY